MMVIAIDAIGDAFEGEQYFCVCVSERRRVDNEMGCQQSLLWWLVLSVNSGEKFGYSEGG